MKLWLRPGLLGNLSAVEKQTERRAAASEGALGAPSEEELEPAAAGPPGEPCHGPAKAPSPSEASEG